MILKIKTPAEEGNSWQYYDGVHSLFTRQMEGKEVTDLIELGGGYVIESSDPESVSVSYLFGKNCGPKDSPAITILYMSFIHHGAKYEVYAGREVYLLNEQGKNIERIH